MASAYQQKRTAMQIGEVAKRANVGVETVRFYERKDLIPQPLKPVGGGFRHYPAETVARILFIRQAQDLGFSLSEIGELLSLRADPATECSHVRDRARAKHREVEEKIGRLNIIRQALETLIRSCPGSGPARACTILEALEHPAKSLPAAPSSMERKATP